MKTKGSIRAKKKIFALLIVLSVAFFVSLGFALKIENRRTKAILYFPHARIEKKMVPRPRWIAKKKNRIDSVKELILQLGLGPNEELRDQSLTFFPLGLRAKTVFVDDGKLTVELPKDFILQESSLNYSTEESLEFMKYNLLKNFNWIREIIVTVDGVILLEWNKQDCLSAENQADSEAAVDVSDTGKERK